MPRKRYITHNGVTKTVAEWSRIPECQVSLHTLEMRIKRGNMTFWDCLTVPPMTEPGSRKRALLATLGLSVEEIQILLLGLKPLMRYTEARTAQVKLLNWQRNLGRHIIQRSA